MALQGVRRSRWVEPVLTAMLSAVLIGYVVADAPPAPKLSTLVPAEPLTASMRAYLNDLAPLLIDEAKYKAEQEQVGHKANAVTALALVLGNHDGANPFKGTAVEIMAASRMLTRAKTYAEAKPAYDALAAAILVDGSTGGTAPTWERAASLGKLMEETSAVNNRLRRNLKRLAKTKDHNIQAAATLAAFAQAAIYDTHEVKNPADLDKWYALMAEMRDAAAELTKQYQVGDEAAVKTSLDRVEKSCRTCHDVFHKE